VSCLLYVLLCVKEEGMEGFSHPVMVYLLGEENGNFGWNGYG
jgi:hypothetical protein